MLFLDILDASTIEKITIPGFLLAAVVVLWRLVVYYGKKDQKAAEDALNALNTNMETRVTKLEEELKTERQLRQESWESHRTQLFHITEGYKESMNNVDKTMQNMYESIKELTHTIKDFNTLPEKVENLEKTIKEIKEKGSVI